MKKFLLPLGALLATVGMSAQAHHSVSMFDNSKRLTVHATVKEWQWRNPHTWMQVMVAEPGKAAIEEGFELVSPNTLIRNGFKRDTFKPGDKVTVLYSPRRDGTPGGILWEVQTPTGVWLKWGSAPTKDNPNPAAGL